MFLPLINDKLYAWRQAWSKRRIRTIKTSYIRFSVFDQMNSTPDGDLGPKQLLHYGVKRVAGRDDNEIADNDGPIFYSST